LLDAGRGCGAMDRRDSCFTALKERSWSCGEQVAARGDIFMNASLEVQIEQLRRLRIGALRSKYRELFGDESRSYNKQFLFRRVAWRVQALAEGDLPERARNRALEIAQDADLRVQPAKGAVIQPAVPSGRDLRLPAAGAILRRRYRGRAVEVKVFDRGFEFEGRRYDSLSAIASEVAGTRWNGFTFFGLARTQRERA
jgi:hypothetical protein